MFHFNAYCYYIMFDAYLAKNKFRHWMKNQNTEHEKNTITSYV